MNAFASVIPLHGGQPATYAEGVDAYLRAAGIGRSSLRPYRTALTTWGWLLAGQQPPFGTARRGAVPPPLSFQVLNDPGTPEVLAATFGARCEVADADTVNRELSILRSALTWWRGRGWVTADPTIGLVRRPAPPDRTKALTRDQIAALFETKASVREKTLWRMLYETCARAEELLCLNVEDLLLQEKRGKVTSKGGATEWVYWQSGTAQLLPRLLQGRERGPLFLTDRRAPARTPTLDVCPSTGRARLSYRRAAELLQKASVPLAGEDGWWTLHQFRHSALTHEAEAGTNTPLLLARSRHASVRSLERYARPGVDAVSRHVAENDPAARRNR